MTIRSNMDKYRATILSWLEEVTRLPVVFWTQDFVRPAPPYVSFKFITGLTKVGQADELRLIDNAFYLLGQRSFSTSIEAFGTPTDGSYDSIVRAMDIINEIQFSLDKPLVQSKFQNAGLSVRQDKDITDITALLESEYEPRAVLDLTFGITMCEEVETGAIETVELEGEFDTDFDGNPDISTGPIVVSKP